MLVFNAIVVGEGQEGISAAVLGVVKALGAGGALGLAGAGLIVLLLKRYWVPDFLQSPVTLAVVMVVFSLSDLVLSESGLLAVTVMGSALASQNVVTVRHIVEFKENLRVLLISALFVILAARLPISDPAYSDPGSLWFLAVLILVVRPASVALSTIGTFLTWRERVFLGFMAPRGIVAAAVASIFSLELMELGYPGAEKLALRSCSSSSWEPWPSTGSERGVSHGGLVWRHLTPKECCCSVRVAGFVRWRRH